MIKIQMQNFNVDEEIEFIKKDLCEVGAVSTFIGYVRNINNNKKVSSIELDVYEDMAHAYLEKVVKKAKKKWNLLEVLIIHRYGKLNVNEKIVLVATFSKHRQNSNKACESIMDFLKQEAPFWKKELYTDDYKWLENTSLKN